MGKSSINGGKLENHLFDLLVSKGNLTPANSKYIKLVHGCYWFIADL